MTISRVWAPAQFIFPPKNARKSVNKALTSNDSPWRNKKKTKHKYIERCGIETRERKPAFDMEFCFHRRRWRHGSPTCGQGQRLSGAARHVGRCRGRLKPNLCHAPAGRTMLVAAAAAAAAMCRLQSLVGRAREERDEEWTRWTPRQLTARRYGRHQTGLAASRARASENKYLSRIHGCAVMECSLAVVVVFCGSFLQLFKDVLAAGGWEFCSESPGSPLSKLPHVPELPPRTANFEVGENYPIRKKINKIKARDCFCC